MYFYKTKRIGLVLILAGCVSAGLYRKAHSLSFSPPEIQNPLLAGQPSQGWHARYSTVSVQAVHNALTQSLRDYYNREKGLSLYLATLKPDYKIAVDYKERHDHSLKITVHAYPSKRSKLQLERQIKIPANGAIKNLLEQEANRISRNLARPPGTQNTG